MKNKNNRKSDDESDYDYFVRLSEDFTEKEACKIIDCSMLSIVEGRKNITYKEFITIIENRNKSMKK